MDYSTISNKTNCTEVEELTDGDLSQRYYLLKKQHENLSCSYDSTKQELHDTRRMYQTALEVQGHLSTELETLQVENERRKNEVNNRITALQEDISQLREERTQAVERHAAEIKKLELQIRNLKEEQAIKTRESPVRDYSELDEARAAVNSALTEAEVAKAALVEAKNEVASWQMRTEELIGELAEMRVAADLRREDLRAAADREAVALADLAEAKAMLHQFTDSQDLQPHGKAISSHQFLLVYLELNSLVVLNSLLFTLFTAAKGNSIFAEVEDKRQEMAKNLIQMKQTNSRVSLILMIFQLNNRNKLEL